MATTFVPIPEHLPRVNETGWDEATLWRTYLTLTDLEAVFRSLKSEFGLRPIYHHKPILADGHPFITVIAYQLVQGDPRCLGRRLCSGRGPQEHRVEDRWRVLVVPLARLRQRSCLM